MQRHGILQEEIIALMKGDPEVVDAIWEFLIGRDMIPKRVRYLSDIRQATWQSHAGVGNLFPSLLSFQVFFAGWCFLL